MAFCFSEIKAKTFLSNCDSVVSSLSERSKLLTSDVRMDEIRQSIKSLAAKDFGNVDVHFFGSRIIGVATDESDSDIFVDLGGKFFSKYSRNAQNDSDFDKLLSAIRSGSDWKIEKSIVQTAVPIIIAEYSPLKIQCDISIINGLSTRNSEIIGHLFSIQPNAVKLAHAIKQWMKALEFNDLKGYTVTLLVLFFLQYKRMMPSMETVQHGLGIKKISGYHVQFDSSRNLSSYDLKEIHDYKELVQNFFEFYSDFNFDQVISTNEGIAKNKHVYKARYGKFHLKGIFIAGPLNCGKNCGIFDDHVKENFIQLCKDSSAFLKKNDRYGRVW